jgi:GH35 family endo-1,4-beta-xylanase
MHAMGNVYAIIGLLQFACLLGCAANSTSSQIGAHPLVVEAHVPWELQGAKERIEKYRKGDFKLTIKESSGRSIPAGTTYQIEQTKHAFLFGGSLAADWSVPAQPWYASFKQLFARLFNYATINFYWGSHEKIRGKWDYDSAPLSSELLKWAKAQGMVLKGHPLVWHQVVPEWIDDAERDVRAIDRDIRRHVKFLIEQYPEVDEWDLYNEVPGIVWKDESSGMRRWQTFMGHEMADGRFTSGPGYVTEAILEIARASRPEGFYILNHYQHDDPFYHRQIQHCLQVGADVDAIGIQTHMHSVSQSFSEAALWDMLEVYTQYQKPIYLSEVSILSCGRFEDWQGLDVQEKAWQQALDQGAAIPTLTSTPQLETYQAAFTRDFYTLAFSHPQVESITWWSITDLNPWRGMPAGLLDADGTPKPVYAVLDQLINHEWTTEVGGQLTQENTLSFNGFYGDYRLRVNLHGHEYVGHFVADAGTAPEIDVVLTRL